MSRIRGICFSKDRAMQLEAVLESFFNHCRDAGGIELAVLFLATTESDRKRYEILSLRYPQVDFIPEKDFRTQTLNLVSDTDFVLFLVDDNIFVRPFSIQEVIQTLESVPEAGVFSLRLGTNTTYCYMKDHEQNVPDTHKRSGGTLSYRWKDATFDFAYPLEVSSSVYPGRLIRPYLESLRFVNPNQLEEEMASGRNRDRYGKYPLVLMYETSVTFCVPVNIVQSHKVTNRHGGQISARQLSDMYDQGIRIDTAKLSGFTPNSVHQIVELPFKRVEYDTPEPSPDTSPDHPLVTVYMVTWNTEKYIPFAIESVLKQSFKDFELIIVDDGSTDNTRQIVQSYPDPRITYIYKDHKNFASGMNEAIRYARGEFIIGVDSDDFVHENYIEHMVRYALENPGFDYYYPQTLVHVDADNQIKGTTYDYKPYPDSPTILREILNKGHGVVPNPGSLKRRSLFDKTGLYRELNNIEDFKFITEHGIDIRYRLVPDNPPYYYRRVSGHGNSVKFDSRNRVMSESLYSMIRQTSPVHLFPELSRIPEEKRRCEALKLGAKLLRKHAETNRERYGHHFLEYEEKLEEEAAAAAEPQHIDSTPSLKIAILPHRDNISVMGEIIPHLKKRHQVRVLQADDWNGIARALQENDLCWVEWATDFAARISTMHRRAKLLVRLHSFEAFREFPGMIHWDNVDQLLLVADHIRKPLFEHVPGLPSQTRIQVIPNCVDLTLFPANDRPNAKRIAYLGVMRPVKNLPLLWQCFKAIHDRDPEFTLHIAGDYMKGTETLHSNELRHYNEHITGEMGLSGAVKFYGRIPRETVPQWLSDKDYLISTSIREGMPVSVIEGMAMGLKPVVHNFPGARRLYPGRYVFDTVEECRNIVFDAEFDRQKYRDMVRKHWSTETVMPQIDALLAEMFGSR